MSNSDSCITFMSFLIMSIAVRTFAALPGTLLEVLHAFLKTGKLFLMEVGLCKSSFCDYVTIVYPDAMYSVARICVISTRIMCTL